VGAAFFPVEEGTILLFARAVGDPNPVYTDAGYAASTEFGRVLAPPTYVMAAAQFDPDYPLRPKPGQPWPTPASAPGETDHPASTAILAEQHFEYHRPVRAGDVLSATDREGERWEKRGRSGRLLFAERFTEYRDQDGELMVTARTVEVFTERPIGER
jgi:acyl dehydratase